MYCTAHLLPSGIGEVDELPPVLDVDVADVHAVVLELPVRGLDVADHQLQAGGGAGRGVVEALADRDRAPGARRRQLDEPDAVRGAFVVVGVEAHLVDVEILGPVHIGDGDKHEFKFPVHGHRLVPDACRRNP